MSLTEHFLRYSMEHKRPIKAMLMEDDKLRNLNLTVTAMDEEGFTCLTARSRKKELRFLYGQLLSASYARGDDGDTLRNLERDGKKGEALEENP